MPTELITAEAAAAALRTLADELIARRASLRIASLEHSELDSIGKYHLVVKWERRL